jgi:hypothetical protein
MNRFMYSILVLFFVTLSVFGSGKKALIVAVGEYPVQSGWHSLSAANDADLMQNVLQIQGFNERDIKYLINEQATKSNILSELEALISNAGKNDVIVFHFSGHGQQITDLNGDELDGFDEALIPYDAYKMPCDNYKGENHIIDDELNEYLERLRQKVGPGGDVIFILDACHSGTATRGENENSIFRGTHFKFELKPVLSNYSEDRDMKFSEQSENLNTISRKFSPYAIISASGQQELNKEIKDQNNKGYGSLTFALGKILTKPGNTLTYKALFDYLRNEMCILFEGKHQQTPQFEGETNRLIFAGNSVEIPAHCRVTTVINSQKAMVNIGELSGLTNGSELSFFPVNTVVPDKSKILAKGTVKRVSAAESEVYFGNSITGKDLINSWGYITSTYWPKIYPSVTDMRADIIRRASANDPAINFSFEMIDPKTSQPFHPNQPLKIGDTFQIKVINNGKRDAFFQIIDIQPNNQINLLFDVSNFSPNDLMAKAGKAKIIENVKFRIAEPVGVEMLKLVASEKQLDLSPIVTQKPVLNRNSQLHEFEKLLNQIFEGEKWRTQGSHFKEISIFTKTFTIVEN